MRAMLIDDDGKRWVRIEDEAGAVWDEPASDYEYIMDLIRGERGFRHTKTRAFIPEYRG